MEQVLAVPAKHFLILMDFRLVFKVCPTAHVWVVYTHRPTRFGLFKNIKSTKSWYEEYRNKEKTKQAFDNPYSDVWRIVSGEEASCCFMIGWLNFVTITKTRNKKSRGFLFSIKKNFLMDRSLHPSSSTVESLPLDVKVPHPLGAFKQWLNHHLTYLRVFRFVLFLRKKCFVEETAIRLHKMHSFIH